VNRVNSRNGSVTMTIKIVVGIIIIIIIIINYRGTRFRGALTDSLRYYFLDCNYTNLRLSAVFTVISIRDEYKSDIL